MFRHSALYRFVTLTMISLGDNPWSKESVLSNRYVVKKALNKIRKYCLDSGSSFLIMVYPHQVDYYSAEWMPWLREAHSQIIDILTELQMKYIDLHDAYKGIDFLELKEPPYDIVHTNYHGHLLAGKALLKKFHSDFSLQQEDISIIDLMSCDK